MTEIEKIEKTVLGCLIQDWQIHIVSFGILKPEHFSNGDHATIYRAAQSLNSKGLPIDLITMHQELKVMGKLQEVGGAAAIAILTNEAVYSSIERHCMIILENFMRRQVEVLGLKIQNAAQDQGNDIFEIIQKAESELSGLVKGIVVKKIESIGEIKETVLNEIGDVLTNGKPQGVYSSIQALNDHTAGWQNGNLVVMAGRPGMGKSSAALDFCLTPAMNGTPVAFFSLEMTKEELTGRALSIISHINVQRIVNKSVNEQEYSALIRDAKGFEGLPFFIDDTPGMTIFDLKTKARKIKREHGLGLVVVDYLQLMKVSKGSKSGNREQEISEISRELKALAKELEVPIIALAQLSREVEKRADKKPMLSDLRESGAIEQDADMVIFILRPEVYDQPTYLYGNQEIPTSGLFMFLIAKFRNGSLGEIPARFIGENTKIVNYNY